MDLSDGPVGFKPALIAKAKGSDWKSVPFILNKKEGTSMDIVMWADLQCPFCLVGEANLMNAMKELGIADQVRLDIKTHQIHRPEDGDGQKEMLQIFQDKEGFSKEGAIAHVAKINQMEKDEAGLIIDFGKVHESVDLDAHRLYKYAADHGKAAEVRTLLHQAYFEDLKILADWNTLFDVARKAGLDEEEVKKMLESDMYKREIQNDEMEFRALGIESVPYFIIDTEVVPEHLTKEKIMEVLQKHLDHPVINE